MSSTLEHLRTSLAGRYRVERELGQGGMATVYLATDLKHDRQVAIKALLPEVAASVGHDRFLREIEIAARLQHPHILPVYDSGDADGTLYYVMPFVAGESLEDLIEREGKLPLDRACAIAREVAAALDYAHRQGVVHRDIKPGNILLSDGQAVVADFGIARALSVSGQAGLTQAGVAVGTPTYMSPEQALGETELDGRTDVYALGCVLYEMLAGGPPFTGKTPQSVVAQAITAERPKLRDGTPGMQQLLEQAMAKEPADRHATAGELATHLDAVSGTGGAAPKWHTARVAGVTAAVLLAAFALFLVLRPTTSDSRVARDAEVIAVVPFTATGQDVQLLGEGMVDLLATNLNGVGGIRVADPRLVLQRWHKVEQGAQVNLEQALEIGRGVEAGSVLSGSVVEAGASVRIRAVLNSVGGEELAGVTVDGNATDILALVDSLSARLLSEIWRSNDALPDVRVSAVTSGSLEAVRAYLAGAQHARRAEWDSAIAAFDRAIAADSSFALVHVLASDAYGWAEGHGSSKGQFHLQQAIQYQDRLPPRERMLAIAAQLFNGQPFAAVDTMRAFVARYPDDAMGWSVLGDVQFHVRPALQLSIDELYVPFERAMAIDSSYVPAYFHPMEMAFSQADSARMRRYLATIDAVGGHNDFTDRYRLGSAVVWGEPDSAHTRLLRLARLWPAGVPAVLSASFAGAPIDPQGMVELLISVRDALGPNDPLWPTAVRGTYTSLLSIGRVNAARELAFEEFERAPANGAPLIVSLASAGYIDMALAEEALASIERSAPYQADYLRTIAALRGRHPDAARSALDRFAASNANGAPPAFREAMRAFAGALQVLQGDTLGGITAMKDVLRQIGVGTLGSNVFTPVRLELALALAAYRDTREEGIRLLRSGFTDGLNIQYGTLPVALKALGEALEASGDQEGAALAYSRFVDLWRDADPELQPQVQDISNRLARLAAEA